MTATFNISPTSCLCWPFAVNRWSHCFYIFRSRSEQHHDSAKGEGTQLRSRLQGFPWLRYTKWKRRHAISMRSKTTLAQGLPADMEDWGSGIPSLRGESGMTKITRKKKQETQKSGLTTSSRKTAKPKTTSSWAQPSFQTNGSFQSHLCSF